MKALICEFEKELPFDALGLFQVDLTTLTSIFTSVMTYLVIMVQFHDAGQANAVLTREPNEEPTTDQPVEAIDY